MIRILEEVVTRCGWLVLELKKSSMQAEDKSEAIGQHFSLKADRESQRLGLDFFKDMCPEEKIIAEESVSAESIPPDCIVFDPLDGTTNFFNGIDDFGVTATQFRNGQPSASATFFPKRNLLVTAVRGQGCCLGPHDVDQRIKKIPWHGKMDKTEIGTDIGSWTISQGTLDTVIKPIAEKFNILSSMAAVEGGRRVLFGLTGAYFNLGIAKIWDAAGMALAIEEAGGVVCAPDGGPMVWNTLHCDWIMAINSELAEVVLEHSRNWKRRT